MAVTAPDLLAPKGEIEPDLFPSEVEGEGAPLALLDRLKAYLEDEEAQNVPDKAAKAWAYHRAYHAVYLSMSANPIQADQEGQGSSGYSADQAKRFKALAEEKLAQYKGLVGEETVTRRVGHGTQSRAARYSF